MINSCFVVMPKKTNFPKKEAPKSRFFLRRPLWRPSALISEFSSFGFPNLKTRKKFPSIYTWFKPSTHWYRQFCNISGKLPKVVRAGLFLARFLKKMIQIKFLNKSIQRDHSLVWSLKFTKIFEWWILNNSKK